MKKLITSYQKLTFLQGAAFAVSLTSIIGIAATVTGLNTFTTGTPISSSQMNTNFNIIKAAIESGSSQMYVGTFDASANPPPPSVGTPGEYYVITAAGLINTVYYDVGDWLISNGSAWQKITPTSAVLTVFGRTGDITAVEGDYDLDQLSDVDLSIAPTSGKILRYNGIKWVAGDDLSSGGPGSVTATEIADGAVTDAKINSISASKITGTMTGAQIADGTIVNADINATAAIDYSKLNIPNTAIPYTKLNIADGDIPVTKISGLPAVTSVLANTIVDNDTTHAPDGNSVFDALAMKLSLNGGTLSVGTISGIPNPLGPSDAANKNYVDSFGQWMKTGADVYFPSGNVGIGTGSPTQKLHVVGNSKFDGNMAVVQGSPSTPSISSFSGASTGIFFPAANTIGLSVSGVEKLRVDTSGNVGIGTTTPSYALHVIGTVAGTAAFMNVSDIRYKKDIKKISGALEKILSIDGVSYKFKNAEFPDLKFSERREMGVIAQTVEKVFPEAVSLDKDGFRSVAYSMLISPIIEAIREMNYKATKLEDENKMLKAYLCERDPNAPFCSAE